MADPKKEQQSEVDALKAEIAALKQAAESARLRAEAEELKKSLAANAAPKRVSGTFRLTEPLYRDAVLYDAGAVIRIEDEVPGRSWVSESVAQTREVASKQPPLITKKSDDVI
jgi:ABC-type branched-subunit amino acid transport system substrate-binding protein